MLQHFAIGFGFAQAIAHVKRAVAFVSCVFVAHQVSLKCGHAHIQTRPNAIQIIAL